MTCTNCGISITGRGKTMLCQRHASTSTGAKFFRMLAEHNRRHSQAQSGLRKMATILKGLP